MVLHQQRQDHLTQEGQRKGAEPRQLSDILDSTGCVLNTCYSRKGKDVPTGDQNIVLSSPTTALGEGHFLLDVGGAPCREPNAWGSPPKL